MFTSRVKLFSKVPCPELAQNRTCQLQFCPFSHEPLFNKSTKSTKRALETKETEIETSRLPTKKQKIDPKLSLTKMGADTLKLTTTQPEQTKTEVKINTPPKRLTDVKTSIPSSTERNTSVKKSDVPSSTSRLGNAESNKPDAVSLAPVPVTPFPPAAHQQRHSFIKMIYAELVKRKVNRPKAEAVKLEYEIAKKSSKVTYGKIIKDLIAKLMKGLPYGDEALKQAAQEKHEQKEKQLDSKLKELVIPKAVLSSQDFVVGEVTSKSIDAKFLIECARCSSHKFHPNDLLTSGICIYHWGKMIHSSSSRKTRHYSCCGESLGESKGCTRCDTHVFRLTDKSILAGYIPYIRTPVQTNEKTLFAAGIDCEMGYTTHGYEMIRLTVVDWTSGKTVLDRTVTPYGKVVDLNTRFSGVKSLEDGTTVDGIHYPTISFKQARDAMFEYVSQSTIIIGHGLDNDLDVLRLIHTNIVDTSLIYPQFNPQRRSALKDLTQMYLSRKIQGGEHDSAEDAIAAMDIVKYHLKKSII